MSFTKQESEEVRLLLANRIEYQPLPSKEGMEEALSQVLHLVHVLNETFYTHVVKDSAIVHQPDLFHQALDVHAKMSDLYQAIGTVGDNEPAPELGDSPKLERYLERLDSEE